jgi:hypothetical protein
MHLQLGLELDTIRCIYKMVFKYKLDMLEMAVYTHSV